MIQTLSNTTPKSPLKFSCAINFRCFGKKKKSPVYACLLSGWMKHCNWMGCAGILTEFKSLLYGVFEQNWPNAE